MKKVEKYIYIAILLIILGILVSSLVLVILSKTDNNETTQVTLTDAQLDEYLSYVPFDSESSYGVYTDYYTDISSIDEELLISMAIINSDYDFSNNEEISYSSYCTDGFVIMTQKYYPLSNIKELLLKMYNYELDSYEEGSRLNASGLSYTYSNGNFMADCGGSTGPTKLSYIDSYSVTSDELVIYEYVTGYSYNDTTLIDYYTGYSIKVDSNEYEEYFENNYLSFTKYKHTFKKSSDGYYWYSTEVSQESSLGIKTEDLDEYLSYVPYRFLYDNTDDEATYTTNINDINKQYLLNSAFAVALNNEYFTTTDIGEYTQVDYVSSTVIDELLTTMYNISLDDISKTVQDVVESPYGDCIATYAGYCFYYASDGFIAEPYRSGDSTKIINSITSYELEEDELIIYAYSVGIDFATESATGYIDDLTSIDKSVVISDCDESSLENYFLTNLTNFTKYKYTFKKSSTGYYWHSTEVV